MTTDERNFRTAYYSKVGCGVDGNQSMKSLLKPDDDGKYNREKFIEFCMKFTVTGNNRPFMWSIILDVAPTFHDSHEFVMLQRQIAYSDMERALCVLQLINETTPLSKVFYEMWLLETRQVQSMNSVIEQNFLSIANVLIGTLELNRNYEMYWITKRFYELTVEAFKDVTHLRKLTQTLIEKDHNSKLYKEKEINELITKIPLDKWYRTVFTDVIAQQPLIKIWDKICSGSKAIVVFVFIEIVRYVAENSSTEMDIERAIGVLNTIKDNQKISDGIVNKAITSWQSNQRSISSIVMLEK